MRLNTLKSWAMFTDGDTKTPDMSEKDLEKMLRAMERTLNPPMRKQKIGRNDPMPLRQREEVQILLYE